MGNGGPGSRRGGLTGMAGVAGIAGMAGIAGIAGVLCAVAPAARAADAKTIAETVCAACHGADGNGVPGNPAPRLAGQQAKYLAKQLTEFASGARRHDVMTGIVATLDKSDFPDLAQHFSDKKLVLGRVGDPGLAEAGRKVYEDGNTESGVPGCQGCHGSKGDGNARFPRVSGQHMAYTLQQMADFRSGTRSNDRGKMMQVVAERMTDAEIRAVAEYLSGM